MDWIKRAVVGWLTQFGHEGTVDGTANIVHNFSSHIRQSRLSKDQSS
ncbi:hypothetical protein BVIET440_50052 [Burkholderia vietnamiensis]